ncbi:MAG: polysaccharide export protein [Mariprofundaceae bacterium]|nr:polysaccharide export protein [Mariprofundaceae bacterium]
MKNFNSISQRLGLLLLILASSACALAPGMRMEESSFSYLDKPDAAEARKDIEITPITAALVASQQGQIRQDDIMAYGAKNKRLEKDVHDYRYLIQARDVVKITVWDHPELTNPSGITAGSSTADGSLVRQDGTIFYPYVGVIKVAGMTVESVRRILAKKLASYVKNPQVDVRITAFRSQKVYITGEVKNPGNLFLDDTPLTLLDAVNKMGGITTTADLSHVTVHSNDGSLATVSLFRLLNRGDISQNMLLKDGDTVHIPNNTNNKIFVMGEVGKQAALPLPDEGMSLAEAISEVGGFDRTSSDPSKVYVIRGVDTKGNSRQAPRDRLVVKKDTKVFHLDSESPDALLLADQFHLQPRDIVYVSVKGIARWGRVFNQVSGAINAIGVTRAITR